MMQTTGETLAPSSPLKLALQLQRAHMAVSSTEDRKKRGQVFTPPEVCRFMAGLFTHIPTHFRLLDPGAGVGSLTAAMCEHIAKLRTPRQVELHLYETDPCLTPHLRRVIEECHKILQASGHSLSAHLYKKDFILAHASTMGKARLLFGDDSKRAGGFDAVIMNPPYFKLAKDSEYTRLLPQIVHGQPNIYTLFLAIGAELLRPGGEMVAITPRSFCSGLYFRAFRRWFFRRMGLGRAHLFLSRKEIFREAGILQESLITLTTRLGDHPKKILLSTSYGRDDLIGSATFSLPASEILDDSSRQLVIRLPENPIDAEIMRQVESWPKNFSKRGFRISTGPVVSFRARQFLCHTYDAASMVPLLLDGSVRRFETVWPPPRNGKPCALKVTTKSERLLLLAKNYVLLRRFSAKEERRRLTASCLLAGQFPAARVALENHLNYVYHAAQELSEDETYGLAALFNSLLLDRYFRTLSGNTQVNATEIRTMPFPDLETLADIGRRVRQLQGISPEETEELVLTTLGIEGQIRRRLLAEAGR
mgnify:CR=1 FL=1